MKYNMVWGDSFRVAVMALHRKHILLLIPVILIGAVAVRIMSSNRAADARKVGATLVKVDSPRRETITRTIQLTGDVLAAQQAQIFAKVFGALEKVYVDLGDHVRTGQVLAMIDTTELAQQCQQALATYENTKRKYGRANELAKQNLSAKQDLDNAEADMRIAEAAYTTARTRLGFAGITAPFDGYITRRYLDPGAVLTTTNATLFTLMDLSTVKIIVHILERDVPQITTGMKADITVDALPGQSFTGTITRLAHAVDVATRTMAVEIEVRDPQPTLKPGMFATVTLTTDQHPNALTIPSQAVQKDAKGPFVYVTDGQAAHRRDVALGGEQQSRSEILSGLDGSETIIVSGQQLVKDGGPISIQH